MDACMFLPSFRGSVADRGPLENFRVGDGGWLRFVVVTVVTLAISWQRACLIVMTGGGCALDVSFFLSDRSNQTQGRSIRDRKEQVGLMFVGVRQTRFAVEPNL